MIYDRTIYGAALISLRLVCLFCFSNCKEKVLIGLFVLQTQNLTHNYINIIIRSIELDDLVTSNKIHVRVSPIYYIEHFNLLQLYCVSWYSINGMARKCPV